MRSSVRIFGWALFGLLAVSSFAATGKELLASGRVDDAIASLQLQTNDAESQNLLCRAYYQVQNWDQAISACEKATNLAPGNSNYHLWLGRAYGEKASIAHFVSAASLAKKVKAEFETAVQLDPQNVDARADLAEYYLQAPAIMGGGTDKALAQAQAIAKLDTVEGDRMLGRVAEKNKDYAGAERKFRDAVTTSNNADSWNDLAQFYQRQGRYDDMEKAIQHVPGAKMTQHASLVQSAETLLNSGRNFNAAIDLLRQYLAKSSAEEAARAHYLLGTLLEKQGDKPGAAQEYRNTLAIARSFASAQAALSRVSH
jgi:tetratricopeptide (TPR) repeat protein